MDVSGPSFRLTTSFDVSKPFRHALYVDWDGSKRVSALAREVVGLLFHIVV